MGGSEGVINRVAETIQALSPGDVFTTSKGIPTEAGVVESIDREKGLIYYVKFPQNIYGTVSLSSFLKEKYVIVYDVPKGRNDYVRVIKYLKSNSRSIFNGNHNTESISQLLSAMTLFRDQEVENLPELASSLKPKDYVIKRVILRRPEDFPAIMRVVSVDPITETVVLNNAQKANKENVIRSFSDINSSYAKTEYELLTDDLKVGDILSDKNTGGILGEVKHIDRIAEVVRIPTRSMSFQTVNERTSRIGKVGDEHLKELPVLEIEKHSVVEAFHAHYDTTRRDKRYIKYCQKLGRDYPETKEYKSEKTIHVSLTDMVVWLKAHLSVQELKTLHDKLGGIISQNQNQSEDLPSPQPTVES